MYTLSREFIRTLKHKDRKNYNLSKKRNYKINQNTIMHIQNSRHKTKEDILIWNLVKKWFIHLKHLMKRYF